MQIEKKHIELALIGALLIVFAYIVTGLFNRPGARDQQRAVINVEQPTAKAGLKFEWPASAKKHVNVRPASWDRDPFVMGEALPGEHASVTSLLLKGIVTEGAKPPKAIINDEIVTVGSAIECFRVTRITDGKVIVTDGKEDFELSIQSE